MANELARLVVKLEAESAKYTAELDKANRKLESFGKTQSNIIGKIKTAFVALGGLYAVNRAAQFIKSQVEAVDAIGEVADAAGIGAEKLQRLQFAFGQLTQATEGQVNQGLASFNKKLGEARGGSEKLQKAFGDLGVDIRQDTAVALNQMFTGLGNIEDGSKRAALAAAVTNDRFGVKMAGAFKQGRGAVDDMARSLESLVTEEQVKAASDLSDTFAKVEKAFSVATASAVLENAEAIEAIAVAMGKVVGWGAGFLGVLKDFGTWLGQNAAKAQLFFQGGDPTGRGARGATGDWSAGAGASGEWQAPPLADVMQSPAGAKESVKALRDMQDAFDDAIEKEEEWNRGLDDIRMEAAVSLERMVEDREAALNRASQSLDQYLEGEAFSFSEASEKMSVYAEQASRNMQDAFADFLFDPFDDGLKGMLNGFINVLRRMVAEAAAAQIFTAVGGGGFFSAIGSLFGGGRAMGGPVMAGSAYMVGENGPEMFIPNVSGSIVPNGGGSVTINQNFTVGDIASKSELISGVSFAREMAKKDIADLLRRGKI